MTLWKRWMIKRQVIWWNYEKDWCYNETMEWDWHYNRIMEWDNALMVLCMWMNGGLGAAPPTSWWRVLKVRGVSVRATRAVGTAKSLYYSTPWWLGCLTLCDFEQSEKYVTEWMTLSGVWDLELFCPLPSHSPLSLIVTQARIYKIDLLPQAPTGE